MSRDDILRCVPHGLEALLISNAVVDGTGASSDVYLDGSEQCFVGHYPGRPILPAAALLEIFGQVGAVLTSTLKLKRTPTLLAQVRNLRVLKPTIPPAWLRVCVDLQGSRANVVFLHARANAGADRVAAATLVVAGELA